EQLTSSLSPTPIPDHPRQNKPLISPSQEGQQHLSQEAKKEQNVNEVQPPSPALADTLTPIPKNPQLARQEQEQEQDLSQPTKSPQVQQSLQGPKSKPKQPSSASSKDAPASEPNNAQAQPSQQQ